ncbi:phage tail protein [Pseudomonas sp. C9-3]|uniref:phage tail protein n=1 Tax=Pseudomonas sp. C9-3 TaxID=3078264 RepID=UPI0028E7F7E7|nr:phage tail protein [Pseudomonas sp. C9-3]
MLAYQFDTAGLYAGTIEADESPMEPGVYLLPARTTQVAPPDTWPEDRWPRYNGIAWDLVNKPKPEAAPDPIAKLTAFLQENPDVAALIDAPRDL